MGIKECVEKLSLLIDEFNELERKTDDKQAKLCLLDKMEAYTTAISIYIKKLKGNTARNTLKHFASVSAGF